MSEEFKQLIANLKDFLSCADLEYRERDAIQSIEYQISEYVDGIESELTRLREASRWIPVEERLPETSGRYICTLSGDGRTQVYEVWFYGEPNELADYSDDWWDVNSCKVTHWRPLPEPPEAD